MENSPPALACHKSFKTNGRDRIAQYHERKRPLNIVASRNRRIAILRKKQLPKGYFRAHVSAASLKRRRTVVRAICAMINSPKYRAQEAARSATCAAPSSPAGAYP